MSRVDPKKLKAALAMVAKGKSAAAAARKHGLSAATVRRHAKREREGAPKPKRGRPKTSDEKLATGLAAYADHGDLVEAAEQAGVSQQTLRRELNRLDLFDPPPEDDEDEQDDEDLDESEALDWGTVEGARRAVRRAHRHLRKIKAGHRGHPSAVKSFSDALTRLRKWEREDAAAETEEQRERRLRRQNGDVLERIEQTVSAYEDEAREKGICLWCKQPVSPELAAKLHGETP